MTPATPATKRIIRMPGVIERTGMSRASIYRLMREGRFPPSIKLSDRAMGWPEADIDAWLSERRGGQRHEQTIHRPPPRAAGQADDSVSGEPEHEERPSWDRHDGR